MPSTARTSLNWRTSPSTSMPAASATARTLLDGERALHARLLVAGHRAEVLVPTLGELDRDPRLARADLRRLAELLRALAHGDVVWRRRGVGEVDRDRACLGRELVGVVLELTAGVGRELDGLAR